MRILLAGGGTAGHTSPLLATADALRRLEPAAEITCLGTPRGLENRVVPEAGYPLELIPPVPLPRKPSVDLLRVPGRLRGAVQETRAVLDRVRPDVVVGYGGYVSMPAYLAARRRQGAARRPRAERAPGPGQQGRRPDRAAGRGELPGHPAAEGGVRRPPDPHDDLPARPAARCAPRRGRSSASTPTCPTLVVTGGSQGARNINDAVSGAARALGDAGVQVLHVVGPKNDVVPRDRARPPTSSVGFVDRMDYALAAADLMVCRAGASSVTEAAAVGVPAVFVPLPIGNGEQELNARPVVDAGGALLVADAAFTTAWVTAHVPALATDAARLAAMSTAASALIPRDADEKLARIVLETGR